MKAIYARQSVDREDSISVESQVEFCQYELRGSPCREYIDRGYSGKDTNRPGFRAMLEDIRLGLVDTVIVYRLDRISRSILDFASMMELFSQYGVEFISSTEKFDTASPIGRAMLNICIVFAQLERETIQRRVADAYHARSRKGFYMGGRVPYGFRLVPAEIEGKRSARYQPVEDEAAQIRRMYAIYAEPEASLGDVLRDFEAHAVRHLRGGNWNTARLSELLRSPVYVRADLDIYHFFREQGTRIVNPVAEFIGENGCYLYSEHAAVSRRGAPHEQMLVLAPHQGIVSSNIWLACRRKCRQSGQSSPARKATSSWLVGKVRCAVCGRALTVRKNQQGRRYFACSGKRSDGSRCPGPGTLRAEELECLIGKCLTQQLAKFSVLRPSAPATEPLKSRENAVRQLYVENEIEALMQRVATADGALLRYIGERVEQLEQEKHMLAAQAAALQAPVHREAIAPPLWSEMTLELRKQVADALIEQIHIQQGRVDLLWRGIG